MEETESDRTLSELVVKELVEQGLDSSMRDSILEAVEDSEGDTDGSRNLPIAGALVGVGAALGYLAGRESTDFDDVSLDDVEEPEIIDDVTGGDEEEDEDAESEAEEAEAEAVEAETETDAEDDGSSGVLGRLLLAAGLLVGIAVLRRRFGGDADEEWEPIEEFEPATEIDADEDDDLEGVDEDEELEAETGDDSEE
ncbi:hypothetical protein [Natronococcus sp.]|uniref:hypothetical protein n=1 Tax=Natronococcus sp. TaxID=35747 RepID=UPI0025F4E53E|nr:hypothetical protein [Natronococcus sp.]